MEPNKVAFIPIQGTDAQIMQCTQSNGRVYFATDTKKIYLDTSDMNKIPMGGNSGIYYGKKEFEEDLEQKEFRFSVEQDLDQPTGRVTTPSVDDLILNSDGCFYRVIRVEAEGGVAISVVTTKLTVAGSGGGGAVVGDALVITPQSATSDTVILGREYSIKFDVAPESKDGFPLDVEGRYELYEYGSEKLLKTGTAVHGLNTILVSDCIKAAKKYQFLIKIFMNRENTYTVLQGQQAYSLTVVIENAEWEYSYEIAHDATKAFTISYNLNGSTVFNQYRTVKLNIDHKYDILLSNEPGMNKTYTIEVSEFEKYELTHGVHYFALQVITAIPGGTEFISNPIEYNIIFKQPEHTTPIISYQFFQKQLSQFTTYKIPIVVYAEQIAENDNIVLKIDNEQVGKLENITGETVYYWFYTPQNVGISTLSVDFKGVSLKILVGVEKLELADKIGEVAEYEFGFKANAFASNSAIQNWAKSKLQLTNSNNEVVETTTMAAFSQNFDWSYGGLQFDKEENGQCFCIKAGDFMTLNYKPFKKNLSNGKTFKIAFKIINCKNYDARFVQCANNKKLLVPNYEVPITLPFQINETVQIGSINVEDEQLINQQEWTFDPNSLEFRNAIQTYKYLQQYELVELTKETYQPEKYFIYQDEEYVLAKGEFNSQTSYYARVFYEILISQDDKNNYVATFYVVNIVNSIEGFVLNAQQSLCAGSGSHAGVSTQYCENSYIELEINISPSSSGKYHYIQYWIDGIPCDFCFYSEEELFQNLTNVPITIGSNDCDIYLYTIKFYEWSLSTEEHLKNFFADAPNGSEMVSRFVRNDILYDNGTGHGTDISPTKLAETNPNCLVHVYTIDRMTKTKNDVVSDCQYEQYQNSSQPKYTAEGISIKVQGTSSEKYVLAAANLDTDFSGGENGKSKLKDADKNSLDGWIMSDNAMPIKQTCTKVNVASCEHVNNVLNQWWYNAFQPYPTLARLKNPKARDTMEFTNGVMFIIDKNETIGSNNSIENNVFKEDMTYMNTAATDRWAKMYSIAQMGNSKNNIEVFHDLTNPLECCVEVKDNDTDVQQMISDEYTLSDIGAKAKQFEFRYVSSDAEQKQLAVNHWNRLVRWMARSNPQPKYKKFVAYDEYTFDYYKKRNPGKIFVLGESNEYIPCKDYQNTIQDYYIQTKHKYGYTNLPLPDYQETSDSMLEENKEYFTYNAQTEEYVPYTKEGWFPTNLTIYEAVKKDYGNYTFNGYIADEEKQKDYTPLIRGCEISDYNYQRFKNNDAIANDHGFTHDTYEYRMAKMLHECEHYLVMDSILFHYLFIERHAMIDNVAKNTFWSTEDGRCWNLTKDYDNDTSDGGDNLGRLTRSYGIEVLDSLEGNAGAFNANQSVWLNFIHGLKQAREVLYTKLDTVTVQYDNMTLRCWNDRDYLQWAQKWQKQIPERCWIEDYRRKYFRPRELYGERKFDKMLQGGPKTHQRKWFETYQKIYADSEYGLENSSMSFRPTAGGGSSWTDDQGNRKTLALTTYSDCYVRLSASSQIREVKVPRNTKTYLEWPLASSDSSSEIFAYLCPIEGISSIGNEELNNDKHEMWLTSLNAVELPLSGASKLQHLIVSNNSAIMNTKTESLRLPPLLEKLCACGLIGCQDSDLDLTPCLKLQYVDVTGSRFNEIKLAAGTPIKTLKIGGCSSLELKDALQLELIEIADKSLLSSLTLNNIDNQACLSQEIILDLPKWEKDNYYSLDLQHIRWEVETNEGGDTIALLDRFNDRDVGPFTLNGTVTVKNYVKGEESALALYSNYKNKFKDLDIRIQNTSKKDLLLLVEFEDGDGNICKTQRVIPGSALKISDSHGLVNKNPDQEYEYTFDGKWDVYNKNTGECIGEISLNSSYDVKFDIILKPKYRDTQRKYKLKFHGNFYCGPKVEYKEIALADDGRDFQKNYFFIIDTETKEYVVAEEFDKDQTYYRPYVIDDIKDIIELECSYGVSWADIVSQLKYIPFSTNKPPLESQSVTECGGYDFIGYSFDPDIQLFPQDVNYSVYDNQDFYAMFNWCDDLHNVIHPEWFSTEQYTYSWHNYETPYKDKDGKQITIQKDGEDVPLVFKFSTYEPGGGPGDTNIRGVAIKPRVFLYGKVTIPAEIDGAPVLKLGTDFMRCAQFNNMGELKEGDDKIKIHHKITHVFCEKSTKLLEIGSHAFSRMESLQYFDFTPNTIRVVGTEAFALCNLYCGNASNKLSLQLSENLYYVEPNGFLSAFNTGDSTNVTIYIPANIALVSQGGFRQGLPSKIASGTTWQFGKPSKLEPQWPNRADLQLSPYQGYRQFVTYADDAEGKYPTKTSYVHISPQGYENELEKWLWLSLYNGSQPIDMFRQIYYGYAQNVTYSTNYTVSTEGSD